MKRSGMMQRHSKEGECGQETSRRWHFDGKEWSRAQTQVIYDHNKLPLRWRSKTHRFFASKQRDFQKESRTQPLTFQIPNHF